MGYIGDTAPDDMAFGKALDRYELEVSSQKRPYIRAREITSANRLRKSISGSSLKEISPARVAEFRNKQLKTVAHRVFRKRLEKKLSDELGRTEG